MVTRRLPFTAALKPGSHERLSCWYLDQVNPLISETNGSLNHKLQTAAEAWGLGAWNVTAYLLRHTGPSHDHLNRLRPLAEIKRRGRWGSDRSVKRYEEAALVTGMLASIPAPVVKRMRECEAEVPGMLRRLVTRA